MVLESLKVVVLALLAVLATVNLFRWVYEFGVLRNGPWMLVNALFALSVLVVVAYLINPERSPAAE